MLVSAPAATIGGSDVVKIKAEAKLRITSQIVADAATYRPIDRSRPVVDRNSKGNRLQPSDNSKNR
jgi:hypothetical protein